MKVRKVTARGTRIISAPTTKQNWAGDEYKKLQKDKISKFGKNLSIHISRGGKTMKLKDIPDTRKQLSTKGITRVTSRGTGTRKSKY